MLHTMNVLPNLNNSFRICVLIGLILVWSLLDGIAYAQVKIGDNQENVFPESLLELESTTKGLLIPRMTTDQRNAAFQLESTPAGLIIFNTTVQALQILQDLPEGSSSTSKKAMVGEKFWATYRTNKPGIQAPAIPK